MTGKPWEYERLERAGFRLGSIDKDGKKDVSGENANNPLWNIQPDKPFPLEDGEE